MNKIKTLQLWLADLKSGKLISHQPARRNRMPRWYEIQLKKEERVIPNE